MRLWTAISFIGTVTAASVAVIAAGQPSTGRQEGRREFRVPSPQTSMAPQIGVFGRGGARLGVTLRELDAATVKQHKLASTDGVLVDAVEPRSAADRAGVRGGDIIVEFDGERVRSIRQLRRLVSETREGHAVKLGVVRDGKKTDLLVTLEGQPGEWLFQGDASPLMDELRGALGGDALRDFLFRFDNREFRAPRQPPSMPPAPRAPIRPSWPLYEWSPGAGRLGVVVEELTPQLAGYFSVKDGVLVATVTPDSAASRAGLKAGDVITAFNGRAVRSPDDLVRAVRDVPDGQEVSLEIVRDRKTLTVKAKLVGPKSSRPA